MTLIPVSCLAPPRREGGSHLFSRAPRPLTIVAQSSDLHSDLEHTFAAEAQAFKLGITGFAIRLTTNPR